jgi:hypothetical protein
MAFKPLEWIRNNRSTAIVGGGALIAGVAYIRATRSAGAASSGAAAEGTLPAGVAQPADVAGLIGQGAALATSAFGIGLGPTESALGLAATAVGTAGSIAESSLGLTGEVVGAVVKPASLPLPPAPAPVTLLYYEARIGPGPLHLALVKGTVGTACSYTVRYVSVTKSFAARVVRGACGGMITWRMSSGPYPGLSLVVGVAGGSWTIVKVMSNGSQVDIGRTGH